ncbi:MAG: hypothetical protein HY720_30420 [Planctomycetes bacterium]|nr:hypothetical protein [Planctomycetota bacterium]
MKAHSSLSLTAASLLAFALYGCGGDDQGQANNQAGGAKESDGPPADSSGGELHSHIAPHGGLIKTIGSQHLELTFDKKNGTITLYVLKEKESLPHAIPARPVKIHVRIRGEGAPDLFEVELLPISQEGDPPGKSSRLVGSHERLEGVEEFETTIRIEVEGKTYRIVFQIDPQAFEKVLMCPMRCEKDKVYREPGKCPVCAMDLQPPMHAHADHNPKHGGQFFMAPNNWHHLEGVLPSRTEFRLYMFNDFTEPISAAPFAEGAVAEIVRLDQEGNAIGEPIERSLRAAEDGKYLTVEVPEEMQLPVDVTVRVLFEGKERPDVFNFTFCELSKFEE